MAEVYSIDPEEAVVSTRIRSMFEGWENVVPDLVPPASFKALVVEVLGQLHQLPEDRWEELANHPALTPQRLHNIAEQAFGVPYGLSVRRTLINREITVFPKA